MKSAGGFVSTLEKTELLANRRNPLLSGLLASGAFLKDNLLAFLEPYIRVAERSGSAGGPPVRNSIYK